MQIINNDVQEKLIQAQPTKAMGKPEYIANTVAFLCNEKTQFIPQPNSFSDNLNILVASITKTKHVFFRKHTKFQYITRQTIYVDGGKSIGAGI